MFGEKINHFIWPQWGGVKAKIAEAAQSKMELAVRVAQAYFSLQALHQGLQLQKSALSIVTEASDSMRSRYQIGLASQADAMLAKTDELNMSEQIVQTKTSINIQKDILRTLVGAETSALENIRFVPLPNEQIRLPKDLNFQLLARRPDLQAMRWQVVSSMHEVQAAKAAFYPSFNLTGLLGITEIGIGNLPYLDTHARNIGLGILLPIFNSGSLNANLIAHEAQLRQSIAAYNQSVLDAAQDVSRLAQTIDGLNQQLQQVDKIYESRLFNAGKADAEYQQGLTSRVSAQEAKLVVISTQATQINLRLQRLQNQISLIQALGGGY